MPALSGGLKVMLDDTYLRDFHIYSRKAEQPVQ